MTGLSRGDIVLLNCPDAPKFDGMLATVAQVTDWGAMVVVNAWVPGLTREGAGYRAAFPEMTVIGRLPQAVIDTPVVARPAQPQVKVGPKAEGTGNACGKCGGMMVRTGTCETCQSCGESSGGCS